MIACHDVNAISGEEIARRAYDRPDGISSNAIWQVSLSKKGQLIEQREMISVSKDISPKATNRVIKFTSPALIRGTALLFLEADSGEETTYLYLPSLRQERRISSSQKTKSFANTEFSYEDLERREVALDTHQLLKEESLRGKSCYLIESVAKDSASSAYSKRLVWIDSESFLPIQIHFYAKNSKLTKEFQVASFEKRQGFWTPTLSSMKDFTSDRETVMKLVSISYDKEISPAIFHQKRFGEL